MSEPLGASENMMSKSHLNNECSLSDTVRGTASTEYLGSDISFLLFVLSLGGNKTENIKKKKPLH